MLPNPLWAPLKSIIVYNRRKIYLDNVVFRCHYIWTVIALGTCSILITSKLYIGDPINCMSSVDIKAIADQYCFIHSTFTKGKLEKGKWSYEPVKENEIHPGVHPFKDTNLTYHTYYQWVWLVLAFQAVLFYYPHWIWEKAEGGRVKMLVGDLNLPMLGDEKKTKQRNKILWYFGPNRGYHQGYVFVHFICEILNFVNVAINIYLTDYFLNFEFSKYGLKLFHLTQMRPYLRDDELARVFPTVTACRIAIGGVAFGKVQHDILCVLPINILNEKVYVFIWFWFLGIAILSILALIYRILTFIFPTYRIWLMSRKTRFLLDKEARQLVKLINYGDWFLIYKLSQNMDPIAYGILLKALLIDFQNVDLERRLSLLELPPKAPPHSPLLQVDVPDSSPGSFSLPSSESHKAKISPKTASERQKTKVISDNFVEQ